MKESIIELREGIAYVAAELRSIHEAAEGDLDAETQVRWDEGEAFVTEMSAKLERAEARAKVLERGAKYGQPGDAGARDAAFQIGRKESPGDILEDRNATPQQLADAVVRSLESQGADVSHAEGLVRRHRSDRDWSRNLLARASDVYASAWSKYATGRDMELTIEERAALSVGSNTNGGYLVPTHLDPSVILTNSGTSNAIRAISRTVTLTTGNTWNGVTSAGVTASWDGELVEVSDDSPTFGAPSIDTHKAQAFVQASIEAFEDIDGLAGDVLMMFADAKDRLEGAAHATGSGTGQPRGIFTALDANTNVELTSTTAATIGKVDLNTVYRSVPVRFRGRSSWLMNPVYALAIHDLGTAVSASYSGDLREGPAGTILNRPLVESDDAPSAQTTTVRDNEIVFGDFSNYVIVDKPGSTAIEFIPHLFNTATNLPDGRRGWYMHFRSGADSVNDLAFRLLQDKTSA